MISIDLLAEFVPVFNLVHIYRERGMDLWIDPKTTICRVVLTDSDKEIAVLFYSDKPGRVTPLEKVGIDPHIFKDIFDVACGQVKEILSASANRHVSDFDFFPRQLAL